VGIKLFIPVMEILKLPELPIQATCSLLILAAIATASINLASTNLSKNAAADSLSYI